MTNVINNKDLYKLFVLAVKDGLRYLRKYLKEDKYISRYYEYPKLAEFESGFPNFSKTSWDDAPKEYKSIFNKDFDPGKIKSWGNIYNYFQNNNKLKSYYHLGNKFKENKWAGATATIDWEIFHNKYYTFGIIEKMVGRYIEENKISKFSSKRYDSIYAKWENSVYLEKLSVNIIIPLLMIKFDFGYANLSESIAIVKMNEKFQLARNVKTSFTESAHETVIGAATHALIFKNWEVKNKNREDRDRILNETVSFNKAINLVNLFFSAIRLETGYNIGYYQVIARPIGWEDYYINDLPQIYVSARKSYPPYFENYGWLRKPPLLTRLKCQKIKIIYQQLVDSKSKRLHLACDRLNFAFLRNKESDTIIDIAVALELLIDSGRSEMTHKLATRIATLSGIYKFGSYTPLQVFDFCKKISEYRGAVIHGSKQITKKKEIKISKEKKIPTIDIGIEILRYTLLVLCKKQEFLDSNKIDKYLLT